MRISAVAFFMIITTVLLSGCGQANLAALEDRGSSFYSRNGLGTTSASTSNASYSMAAPVDSVITTDTMNRPNTITPASTLSAWQWPVEGRVTETFGLKSSGVRNEGIVIAAAEGTPIRAAQEGSVVFVGEDNKNYGNIVILRHADGTMASYSHAKSITVRKGEPVQAGGVIAYVGQTGNAKTPQLHFAVREGRTAIDPMSRLPQHFAAK